MARGSDPQTSAPGSAQPFDTASGPGRLLVAVYGVFAVSAFARAAYQIGDKFHVAPLAYSLSAFSAVVYLLATFALAKGGARWGPIALASVAIEAIGVLVVGSLTTWDAQLFADDTVWSNFGQGYGYVPLLLPFVGLAWIMRRRSLLGPAQ